MCVRGCQQYRHNVHEQSSDQPPHFAALQVQPPGDYATEPGPGEHNEHKKKANRDILDQSCMVEYERPAASAGWADRSTSRRTRAHHVDSALSSGWSDRTGLQGLCHRVRADGRSLGGGRDSDFISSACSTVILTAPECWRSVVVK